MKRRRFLGSSALVGLFAAFRPGNAEAQVDTDPAVDPLDDSAVDPYFLDTGEIEPKEQESITNFEQYRGQLAQGKEAILPRGGKPTRAPTYRFLYWDGGIDDDNGRFLSPLTVQPMEADPQSCDLNAEILGFGICTDDFPKKTERGTLTVEFRTMQDEEKVSWMYVQQFQVYGDGTTDLGMEYIAQRADSPRPISLEASTLDVRLQLMRQGKRGGFLGKVLKVAGVLSGLKQPSGDGVVSALSGLRDTTPALRIPRMPKEGVALGQAVLSGVTNDAPVWRSGYNTYSLTADGGRMKLSPGIWIAIDGSREMDMANVKVADLGGRVGLTRNGERLNVNYLILDFQIKDS